MNHTVVCYHQYFSINYQKRFNYSLAGKYQRIKIGGLTSLLEVLEEELQARERVTSEVTKSARNGKQTSIPTGVTLFSGVYRGTGCCYCEQSHSPKDCRVVKQVEARRQILKKAGRCFMCLCTGHISKECRSKIRCRKCGKRHHNTSVSVRRMKQENQQV